MAYRLGIGFVVLGSICSVAASEQPAGTEGPLSLERAEQLLIERNLTVTVARQQIDIAEAARRIAGLRPNPNVQIGVEQLPFTSNIAGSVPRLVSTSPDAGANPTYTAQFAQLIERGGKRELRSGQAEAVLGATRAQVLDTIRQQLLELRLAFTRAVLAMENLQIALETEREYEQTERLMERRLKAGDVAGVDLQRVKAARLPYMQTILDSRLAYTQAVRDIATVLGQGPTAGKVSLEIKGELRIDYAIPPLERLRAMAMEERPDLRAAQFAERAAERGTRLAEAGRKRDITAGVEYQRVGNDNAVGAVVSFPLLVFNNQQAAIAQAAAQQRVAATQTRLQQSQIVAEVDKAYEAVNNARQLLSLYSGEAIELSRSIRETITYSYHRGEADLLEVLDAQRSANQILTSYNQARAAYQSAVWQLENAVGRAF